MNERKQWFIDRIGKRVFNTLFCDCFVCKIHYDNGVPIDNRYDAISTHTFESDLQAEGEKFKYFDTKEERTQYEKENNL